MERRARGNHRIDGILLLDVKVDEKCSLVPTRLRDRGNHLRPLSHMRAANAMSVGELDEVRTKQRSGFVILVVEKLLPLAHHAEIPVVDDGDVDVEMLLRDGRKLG